MKQSITWIRKYESRSTNAKRRSPGRISMSWTGKAVRDRGLILEPVDIKKDLYGFAYAPEKNSCGL